ncbi:DNA cytosine methyltransferase [Clostridium sp. BNL1100]|uniref:DNA cytosine methyltransferase n=1 Tax=Clostridium sp. BNL1100 TaxID=755731 RepID=UPI000303C56C|nr:DNA cytosine methyltransferase [Clostridium sp. BNL1100]
MSGKSTALNDQLSILPDLSDIKNKDKNINECKVIPFKFIDVKIPLPSDKVFTVVSLFSGCGGKDLGFRGDFAVFGKHYERNNFNIIWANDIESHACETYKHNFKHDIVCNDIKNVDINTIPKADIVIGGFPCQDFSIAGLRKGLSSERGQLYLEMKRVIEHCQPLAFIAENVEGLTNINGSNETIELIKEDFAKCGYNVTYNLFHATDYGVPQTRKRVFIIGIREDLHKTIYLPKPDRDQFSKDRPWMTAKEAIDDLWGKLDAPNIFNHTLKDVSRAKFYEGKKLQGNCRISADKPSVTIRAEHHGNIEGHYRTTKPENPDDITGWRRLSVRECARIQTFPDDFEFKGAATYTYKQIGNAVPPVLGWYIARALYLSLIKE